MGQIVGTYTNAELGAKLQVTTDNGSGGFAGKLTVGANTMNVDGNWHTASIAPFVIFSFHGGLGNPALSCSGSGTADNLQFAGTQISLSVAAKGGVLMSLSGPFVKS